ncbi:hypothetical protein G7Y89_g6421 [Cudoniella acicularis]|uniref:acetate--CoA ligase n=1 Tax=Cudoniella acicularis TaxID=354080 RepID=A0A8H4W4S5_9HELO|nr:hypothetical protein G7Y89_g6421 [Cudoniella acicularis]
MSAYNVSDEPEMNDIPQNLEEYRIIYAKSIQDPTTFWAKQARKLLDWYQDFQTPHSGTFLNGDNAWFLEGRLNASYNCIDRHALKDPNKVAIISEADEIGNGRKITFGELLRDVSRLSYILKDMGAKKGDIVVIYLPNIAEALVSMLACARIGVIHSVVFMGFSAASLADRILDAQCTIIITTDEARRGGKIIWTKAIVNEALLRCPGVKGCLVLKHTGSEIPWCPWRDFWWHDQARKWPAYYPPESMSAEDPLFLLYTSGFTGKPKGLMHTTAGFLVGAVITTKYVFDMQPTDKHSWTPSYPSFSRFWDIIDEHHVTHFYAAPTALRILKRAGSSHITVPRENLRVLGSIGEPIASEVWKWYFEEVGRGRANIVDTETGCHVITPLVGSIPTKPGCCTVPFLGIEPAILDPMSGEELHGKAEGVLVLKNPWPSMARTVYRAHDRYMDTYFDVYQGYYVSVGIPFCFIYELTSGLFTGDGAYRDEDGYYWIRGRVDDVVNVSGHRLSTAEVEAALLENSCVAEAAAVAVSDEIIGQALVAYVALKNASSDSASIREALKDQVPKSIGAFATPKDLYFVSDLPKTRSGKIMRRILRKILEGEREDFGNTSTASLQFTGIRHAELLMFACSF